MINFIFTFSFFLSITIPANSTLYYIDSLYESGDYKNSAKILNELYNEDKNNIRLDKGTINWLKSDQGIIQLGCAWKTALWLLKKESAKFGSLETEYKSLKSDGRLVGMNFSEDIKIEMKDIFKNVNLSKVKIIYI